MQVAEDPGPVDGSIHLMFSLSYAQYLVLNRTKLQSMTLEWQNRFVGCIEELNAAFVEYDDPAYYVQVLKRETQLKQFYEECEDCAGTGVEGEEGERDCNYCGGDGEIEEELRYETAEEVGFAQDPIPPHSRGRTRLKRADQK